MNITQGANSGRIFKLSLIFLVVVNLLWVVMPIVMAMLWSLVDPSETWTYPDAFPKVLSFQRWLLVWQTTALPSAMATSYYIAFITAMLTVILAMPTAYVLGRHEFKGKKLAEFTIILPIIIPGMIIALFFSSTLINLGLSQSIWGIIIGHTVLALPYAVRLLSASFQSVPEQLVHASRDLGASRSRTFFDVYVPMIKPGLLAALIFSFIVSLEEFNISYVIGTPTYTTIPTILYSFLGYNFVRPNAAVVSLILVIPNVLLMLFIERLLKGNYLSSSTGK